MEKNDASTGGRLCEAAAVAPGGDDRGVMEEMVDGRPSAGLRRDLVEILTDEGFLLTAKLRRS